MAHVSRWVAGIAAACVAGSIALPHGPGLTPPAAASMIGCFADNCTNAWYDVQSNEGVFLDADTWVSALPDGTWREFFGSQKVTFHPDFGGRTPYWLDAQVSVSATPLHDGNVYAEAVGNLVEQNDTAPNQISIYNSTCSKYYVRVVIHAAPVPAATIDDAGTDASVQDAGDSGAAEPDAGDGG